MERNRHPYRNLNWDKVIQIQNTTHTHRRTQADLDQAVERGMEFFTLSNYYPSAPTYPLRGAGRSDFEFRQTGYIRNGEYFHQEMDWRKLTDELKLENVNLPEYKLALPMNVMEAPNAEHHNFTNPGYSKLHVNAPGSFFSSSYNLDLFYAGLEKDHQYHLGCGVTWQQAFRWMLEYLMIPDGGGITINHPRWSYLTESRLLELLDFDPRVLGIEVYNQGCDACSYTAWSECEWDRILTTGRQCFGFFTQDHPWRDNGWHGRNILLVEERTPEACLRAMRQGNFYGALNGDGFRFKFIRFQDGAVQAECTEEVRFVLISAQGVVKECKASSFEFALPREKFAEHTYLRLCAHTNITGGEKLFSQPYMLI